jgi:4-hydroxy-2-oxoheptanedioate aldolase
MSKPTSFVETVESEQLSVGTLLKSSSVTVAEALSYTDLSFLLVDRQHGSPVLERLENVVRATDLNDLPVAVRVPRDDTSMITYLLDLGVRGIVLPQVETTDYVEEASSHVRYSDGRSLGSTTRAARFGEFEGSYVDYVNDHLALFPMVESVAAVENAERLAAMEEVTALLVGPGDLAHSLGTEFWSDRHRDAIGRVFDAAEAQDCPAGIFVSTEEQLADVADRASFVVYGNDTAIVTDHVDDVASRYGE